MKKVLFVLIYFITSMTELKACDICGCGAGNSYIGILPEFRKKIFGLRYRYNILRTHIGAGGSVTYLTTKEYYRTTELWTGWNIGSKIRVLVTLPYQFDEKQTSAATKSKSGIGDMSVAGFYEFINQRKTLRNGQMLVQSFWAGAGVKLPTGKYETADKSSNNSATNLFQLGTGSTDFYLNTMYDIRLNDLGLNTTAAYKINTANKDNYRYGNKFSLSSQLYYKFRLAKKFTLAPDAGILFESSAKDLDKGFTADLSGGNLLAGTAGAEISLGKTMIGFNFQAPLSQHLAGGFVQAKGRGMLHIAFSL